MCGIAGFSGSGNEATVLDMISTLRHRGPDFQGHHFFGDAALAHARLSIIDLSPESNQPFFHSQKDLCIVFNGEIYNFQEIRDWLRKEYACEFRTRGDTEVLLSLYEKLGTAMFSRLNGMFAFAIRDGVDGSILLARDRMGKKPLYYAIAGNTLVFGSEIKSLLRHPAVSKDMDPDALNAYLSFDYVPGPMSIYKGIRKLEPGSWLRWKEGKIIAQETWWEAPCLPQDISFQEAKSRLDELMSAAVKRRLLSDVPLGVFLSGGLDSSTVAWYAQQLASAPVKTFSIGFQDPSYDESSYAQKVAKQLGTEHHEARLSPEKSLEIQTELDGFVDEPFADPSLIPTYFLSKFTKSKVTVALGGDGSDELLAGYPTFISGKLLRNLSPLKSLMGGMLQLAEKILPRSDKNISLDFKIHQFLKGLDASADFRHPLWLSSFSPDEKKLLLSSDFQAQVKGKNGLEIISSWLKDFPSSDPFQRDVRVYLKTYLPDDILFKVDRASMYTALEVRAPFLDVEVVEFLLRLPESFRMKGLNGKYILKELMRGRLPDEIIDRPKKGFGIPLSSWLRGELKGECLDLLSDEALRRHGYFNVSHVRKLQEEHFSGKRNHRKLLWNLMVFQKWAGKAQL